LPNAIADTRRAPKATSSFIGLFGGVFIERYVHPDRQASEVGNHQA